MDKERVLSYLQAAIRAECNVVLAQHGNEPPAVIDILQQHASAQSISLILELEKLES